MVVNFAFRIRKLLLLTLVLSPLLSACYLAAPRCPQGPDGVGARWISPDDPALTVTWEDSLLHPPACMPQDVLRITGLDVTHAGEAVDSNITLPPLAQSWEARREGSDIVLTLTLTYRGAVSHYDVVVRANDGATVTATIPTR